MPPWNSETKNKPRFEFSFSLCILSSICNFWCLSYLSVILEINRRRRKKKLEAISITTKENTVEVVLACCILTSIFMDRNTGHKNNGRHKRAPVWLRTQKILQVFGSFANFTPWTSFKRTPF